MAYGNGGGETMAVGYPGKSIRVEPPRQTVSVNEELNGQDKRLEAVHELIGQLGQRLSAALRPEMSTNGPSVGEAQAMPPAAPLVEALRIHGYRLDGAMARLQDLLNRIEL